MLLKIVSEWREALDSIEWPILILDLEGRITRLNKSAQRLSGLEFHELLERPVGAIGSWQPWREIADMARVVADSRAGLSRDVSGERRKAWQVTASFSPNLSSRGGGIIVVARDITVVTQLEAQVQRSEAVAAMGALVSGVAHEVRNPLFAISATIDALEAISGDGEKLGSFLQTLRAEADRLVRLMQDLLDYGKPPALDLTDLDVGDAVAAAVRACEPLANRLQVSVRNGVERGLARLRLDRGRISQALGNLLENALHYSPAGRAVEIRGAILPASGMTWLEICVEDRGPGFRPEDLRRIFDPFFTRRRGGTGLGLSIVRRIVEAHSGTVEAENRPGGGATMSLRLPMSIETQAPGGDRQTEDRAPDGDGRP